MARVALVNLRKCFGATVAVTDLNLHIHDGEFLTLLGGSGCGKTTTLNLIAGLESPSSGHILFDDVDITALSPRDRNVAVVFQSYALYPHKTVAENLAFPLRMARVAQSEIAARTQEIARLLQIETLLARKPRELSGGQQQRVALGRALIRRPRVFLLDEPLSNVDARLRLALRQELKALHQAVQATMIYVTHDQEEAMALSDRIAVMHGGSILQCASPQEVYSTPAHLAVAQFVGTPAMNIIEAERSEQTLRLKGGLSVAIPLQEYSRFAALPQQLFLGIRPEHVRLLSENMGMGATVRQVDHLGKEIQVQLDCGEFKLRTAGTSDCHLQPGSSITWEWNWSHLLCFDPRTGRNLALRQSGQA